MQTVFPIKTITEFKPIADRIFYRDNYSAILALLMQGRVKGLPLKTKEGSSAFSEYLPIYSFKDENSTGCIITIYDNNVLYQAH